MLDEFALHLHFKGCGVGKKKKEEEVKNRAVMTNTKEIYLIKYARKLRFQQAADSGISHGKRRLSLPINLR